MIRTVRIRIRIPSEPQRSTGAAGEAVGIRSLPVMKQLRSLVDLVRANWAGAGNQEESASEVGTSDEPYGKRVKPGLGSTDVLAGSRCRREEDGREPRWRKVEGEEACWWEGFEGWEGREVALHEL